MIVKPHINPNGKVGLRLTESERKLVLEEPIYIHDELADPIRSTPIGTPIMLTLDDLDDLGGYIAAEANHTTNKRLRKKLDAIFSKIQDLLESQDAQDSPKSLKIEDAQREKLVADRTVQLAEWAARMLIGAEQLGIKSKSVTRFPLTQAEQTVLTMTPTIDEKIMKKLTQDKPTLTVGEVGGLLMAIAEALLASSPPQGFALIMTAKSLMSCLEAEVKSAIKPAE